MRLSRSLIRVFVVSLHIFCVLENVLMYSDGLYHRYAPTLAGLALLFALAQKIHFLIAQRTI